MPDAASASVSALLRRVSRRAADQPETVLPVLRVLAGEEPADPRIAPPPLLAAARTVNAARVERARRDFVEHGLTTEQVAGLLGIGSRQAVAQRRARGGLLGARVGATTYHPAWQFGDDGLAPGLARLLRLLPADAREADSIMRMPHSELGGRSLADLFRAGEWQPLESWLGDIAGWRE